MKKIIFKKPVSDGFYISTCGDYTVLRNNSYFPKNTRYTIRKRGVYLKGELKTIQEVRDFLDNELPRLEAMGD